jgi:hypothetical protein
MKVRRKKIHGNGKSETKRNECSESQNYFCMFVRKSGPLCRVCSSGYYLDSATGYCEDCDDAGSGSNISALFVIFAVLLLAGLAYMYRRRRRQRPLLPSSEDSPDAEVRGDIESRPRQRRHSTALRATLDLDIFDHVHRAGISLTTVKKNPNTKEGETEQPTGPGREKNKWVRRASMVTTGVTSAAELLEFGIAETNGGEGDSDGGGGGGDGGDGGGGDDEKAHHIKTKLRIMVAFFQLVSSVGFNLSIEFPRNFSSFTRILRITEFELIAFLPVACVYPDSDYYSRLASTTLFPIVLGLGLLALHVRYSRNGGSRIFFDLLLNLLYIVLPSTSSVILRTFKCVTFNPDAFQPTSDELSFLASDFSLACGEEGGNRRQFWEYYAYAMMLLFPIGIPLFFAVLLYRHRHDLCPRLEEKGVWFLFMKHPEWGDGGDERSKESQERTAHLSFLTDSYEPHCFWFEVVECARRLLLSSMLILLDSEGGDGSVLQTVAALAICLSTLRIYAYYNPYDDDDDDLLAEVAQWQFFAILFAALLIRVEATADDQKKYFGLILIIISCLGFAGMGIALLRILMRDLKVSWCLRPWWQRRSGVTPTLPPAVEDGESHHISKAALPSVVEDDDSSSAGGEDEEDNNDEEEQEAQEMQEGHAGAQEQQTPQVPREHEQVAQEAETVVGFGESKNTAGEEDEEDEFEDFLDLHGLQPYAEAIHEYGIERIEDFYDEDILSDEDLEESLGMNAAEIERFRAVLAIQPHSTRQESSSVPFGKVVPITSPSTVALTSVESIPVEATHEPAELPEAEAEGGETAEEEDEFEDFLDRHGLQPYAEAILEYGIERIEDFYDEDILSDEDLAESLGLNAAEIARFRAVLETHPLEEGRGV